MLSLSHTQEMVLSLMREPPIAFKRQVWKTLTDEDKIKVVAALMAPIRGGAYEAVLHEFSISSQ